MHNKPKIIFYFSAGTNYHQQFKMHMYGAKGLGEKDTFYKLRLKRKSSQIYQVEILNGPYSPKGNSRCVYALC